MLKIRENYADYTEPVISTHKCILVFSTATVKYKHDNNCIYLF